jgi:hypothetical protein
MLAAGDEDDLFAGHEQLAAQHSADAAGPIDDVSHVHLRLEHKEDADIGIGRTQRDRPRHRHQLREVSVSGRLTATG